MELWIKVQNNKKLKQGLVKVDDLFVDKNEEDKWIIRQCCGTLGIYKTEKRALEVLYEIQKLLQPQTLIKCESKLEFHPECTIQNIVKTIPEMEIKELSTYVYEMPKE